MRKFAGLEICRFLSAVSVVVWHYQHFFYETGARETANVPNIGSYPLFYILDPFYLYGNIAVQVFWVVSGFIFFWKYSDAIHEKSLTPENFFIFRFSRLYPLHFLTLIAVAILNYWYFRGHGEPFVYGPNTVHNFMLQLVLASNWIGSQPSTFNGPIWSVSVEVLAYLCFFVLVRYVRPSKTLCVAIIICTRAVMYYPPLSALICIHFFFWGGLIQLFITGLNKKYTSLAFCGTMGALILGIAFLRQTHHVTSADTVIISVGVVTWFALVDSVNGLARLGLSRLSWVGDLTYSSYLLHYPIQLCAVIIVDYAGFGRHLFLSPGILICFLFTTFGLAWIVRRHFEAPMQDAIRALWVSRRTEPALLDQR